MSIMARQLVPYISNITHVVEPMQGNHSTPEYTTDKPAPTLNSGVNLNGKDILDLNGKDILAFIEETILNTDSEKVIIITTNKTDAAIQIGEKKKQAKPHGCGKSNLSVEKRAACAVESEASLFGPGGFGPAGPEIISGLSYGIVPPFFFPIRLMQEQKEQGAKIEAAQAAQKEAESNK